MDEVEILIQTTTTHPTSFYNSGALQITPANRYTQVRHVYGRMKSKLFNEENSGSNHTDSQPQVDFGYAETTMEMYHLIFT